MDVDLLINAANLESQLSCALFRRLLSYKRCTIQTLLSIVLSEFILHVRYNHRSQSLPAACSLLCALITFRQHPKSILNINRTLTLKNGKLDYKNSIFFPISLSYFGLTESSFYSVVLSLVCKGRLSLDSVDINNLLYIAKRVGYRISRASKWLIRKTHVSSTAVQVPIRFPTFF